jgi:hypothetical protein
MGALPVSLGCFLVNPGLYLAGRATPVPGDGVAVVAFLVPRLRLAVSAMRSEHATLGTLAVGPGRVGPVITLLLVLLHAVATTGAELAAGAAFAIAAVVDAVIALFTRGGVDDGISADPFLPAVGAAAVATDVVAIVTLFAEFRGQDAITAPWAQLATRSAVVVRAIIGAVVAFLGASRTIDGSVATAGAELAGR